MNDISTPWLVVSFIVVLVVAVLAQNATDRKVLGAFVWSVIIVVLFLGRAVIAVLHGEYRRAGGLLLWLLLFMIVSGVIPGLLLHLRERVRERKLRRPSCHTLASPQPVPPDEAAPPLQDRQPPPQTLSKESREVCPRCGNQLQRRIGRYGPFLGCSCYPRCRYTRSI